MISIRFNKDKNKNAEKFIQVMSVLSNGELGEDLYDGLNDHERVKLSKDKNDNEMFVLNQRHF